MALKAELLYELVGSKVRRERENLNPRMSQACLAEKVGLTRASVVNIEAGRQKAPLHVLWQIAEALGTELPLLLPHPDEYLEACAPIKLNEQMVAQIENEANGNPLTRRLLTQFVSRAKTQSEPETHD